MLLELMQAAAAILTGCLIGALVYLVPEALGFVQPRTAAALPRAVIHVPEQLCHSLRCLLSHRSGHFVEVEVLEKTTQFVKVRWPRGFGHLDEWVQLGDLAGLPPVPYRVRVVEQLPAFPMWTPSEFEQWLNDAGASLDALDTVAGAPPPP